MTTTTINDGCLIDGRLLLGALRATGHGDFTCRLPLEQTGLAGEVAVAFNFVMDLLSRSTNEVQRVSEVVGTEGKISQRASLPGATGGWAIRMESINRLINNLVRPTVEVSRVIGAVAQGDLDQRMSLEIDGAPLQGEFLRLGGTVNTMVDQLGLFASEVTRVAREVGTDGKLGGQAVVKGVEGTWKDLTDNVNGMASNLTNQVRNIADVTTAVASGDLSKKITADAKGEILELKSTINVMVDQLNSFASEVSRVAREVGTEGKLGGQAVVKGVAGTWKDLTDNVNLMTSNLSSQVRNIAEVSTAIGNGDLSKTITVDAKGEIQDLKSVINGTVDRLNSFGSEVTRVAREVGAEGKLGGQAEVTGVAGMWKDLTESVNFMAANLTGQVRNIADVTTAVAKGDLSKKITADAKGEILELKDTINVMVDQLNSFASEVTRVAREVGTDGKLGGQAAVPDVGGTWKDLTDNVNLMASNLTNQVRNIADVTTAVAKGDLSKKITAEAKGEFLELKSTINVMVDQLNSFASEVTRVAREVGTDGKLGGQAKVPDVGGTWKDLTDNVNGMATNLTNQVRNIADVTTAVAKGDLSKKITADASGEILELKNTINVMVDQLNSFASEVTRVAREVGTDGKLGGQAKVPDVGGTWKDLTDNVNSMAANLTDQVRNIAQVTTAVAKGDLTQKITADAKGEILELKNTINVMVDQLNSFASEVSRVAREVGSEGMLGGQAEVEGVGGTWKDLTDNVNGMAGNLTSQVRNIAQVTTAVANGDLSKKITADAKGEIFELKNTINVMVDQLNSFASEVTRVAREVGTDGKLGGQAEVTGVGGTWKDLTDSVNGMAGNLTSQVRNIAQVTTAVANGDLSKKITADAKGEILELKNTINVMVDQLNSFASEVSRVAREVGSDGKLGGQAAVPGVGGTWKDLTDNVNSMAANLTDQVRNIAQVTTAVANGDLSKKITADAKGEILELKNTINVMVDQLNSFASEVSRVAREVGSDGKLGGQADVKGVGGTWKDLTDNVNSMAANLTDQVRNIAQVTTAVANGDLSKKITAFAKGEILELKDTINVMVDQLNSFASEVSRVAREVGSEGKLGGQAQVKGVGGTWKDLTENVNGMASNLTAQVRNIADVTISVANGDLSKKIAVDVRGEFLQLKDAINTMVDQLRSFASEVTRVAREVGTEGKLGGQAVVPGVAGVWKDLTDNVNGMGGNLTSQVRNIAQVTTAVAKGDLTQKITVDAKGEIQELKNTINTMVDQLNSFASEVTRVAREVGTDGKLGGQGQVKGVSGTWKDLTDSVNFMAGNLTDQVRGIAKVVTGVANGDLKQKLTVPAKGEIAALADTINNMIDTLATFADQVTGVAREVGVEGKLGGQADVPGAAGIWKNLTDNVNELAANLSSQVRAIAEVATSVTKGDLTRSITVEARGEVAELKDNVNQMIANLRDTTMKNTEQDWLKTNLAKFTRVLQGQREMVAVAKLILDELTPLVSAQHGVFYIFDKVSDQPVLRLLASYAYQHRKGLSTRFRIGEGLVGQCALEKDRIVVTDVPRSYVRIGSGLGNGRPRNIAVIPILFEGDVKAVVELASFNPFTDIHLAFLDQLAEGIGIVLNSISAGMRTEQLLTQSQSLAQELQSQQSELQEKNKRLENQTATLRQSEELLKNQQDQLKQNNEELGEKARLLALQKNEVEIKNQQIEMARTSLQEKAEQLALTSKYKSEFLANMSHELRTPLNSLLLLSKLMAENPEGNLQSKQLEYVRTIHGAGSDLLTLINGILDMAKIESGTVEADPVTVSLEEIRAETERNFAAVAEQKGLTLEVILDPRLPQTIYTDGKRLGQVLKNLLSNACKFTHQGRVGVSIVPATSGWSAEHPVLSKADKVIAFRVTDTGIGIDKEMLKVIFEPFHQADGTTARKYGGTGLGLSISREIARLLGGEIGVESEPGKGSTFTFYLPQTYDHSNPVRGRKGAFFAPPTSVAPSVASSVTPSSSFANRPSVQAIPALRTEQFVPSVADDRDSLKPGDRTVLIIDDDPTYAGMMLSLVRERGLKGVVALTGRAGLSFAVKYHPAMICLDLLLPDINGWIVLDELKRDPETAHIPVQVVTVVENDRYRALRAGALGFQTKSNNTDVLRQALCHLDEYAARNTRQLLVLEGQDSERRKIVDTIGNHDVTTTVVGTCTEAIEALHSGTFDCLVVDPTFPDRSGFQFLKDLQKDTQLATVPIVVYTPQALTPQDRAELNLLTDPLVARNADSLEEVLVDTTVFLHRNASKLPESKREVIHHAETGKGNLAGKKILIIDDDPRNVIAMTAALEQEQLKVLFAESGQRGLEILEQPGVADLVLMDIMMPEMDGYETTRRLRRMPQCKDLPVIAVTAKAMKGDRENCLESGCSDYLPKPVDSAQLISMLRIWIGC